MPPVLARPGLEEWDLPRDATVRPRVVRWRSDWSGPGSAALKSLIHCTWDLCVFPNNTRFQSNKHGCGSSLHSKRNKRKQRHTLCPSLEWPADFFPGKMCSRRGGSTFVAAAWIQSLPASTTFSGALVWDPKPHSQWGVRGWAGGVHPSQPRSKPLAHKVPERRMAGELLDRTCPAPGGTAPPAGIPGMSLIWEASGPPLGEGRSQTWNFSGVFVPNPLSISAP